MPKIISICNQKGGVGKTTTAINLSAYLAVLGKNVLLIDSDPQGNCTSGLGFNKQEISKSIYNILIDELDTKQVILKTNIEKLSLIPSNLDLTGAEVELVSVLGRENRLKKALSVVSNNYDFVIIDCPPSLGLLTINALNASTSVLIPIQCEYYALEGLSQLVNTVNLVRDNLNPSLTIEGVLLTMADFRTKLTDEVIKEARNYFKEKVYNTVIPRNIKITEAPGFGKPLALYDKLSIGAKKYEEFAKELLGEKKDISSNSLSNKELEKTQIMEVK